MNDLEEKLKDFLNLFWLRPENGLLCTFKSKAFNNIKFESPSLDISCGDGLFMFMHLGGKLESNFDYYKTTKADEFKHESFTDIYDCYDEKYSVPIIKHPEISIDYGTDWKQALLNKTSKLDLYKNLILHDSNVLPLPFEDNYFRTVYSNSLYWVKNVKGVLTDIHRILKPDGIAVLEVATPYFYQTLTKLEQYLSPSAISILDRNRRITSPGTLQYKEWKELLEECNFTIESSENVYPNELLIDFWNIGLRPISHLLIQMTKNLTDEERHKIKTEWVEIFYELFKPLLSIKQNYSIETSPYVIFKLKK